MRRFRKEYFFPVFPQSLHERVYTEFVKADKIMLQLLFLQWFVAAFVTSVYYETYLLGFVGGGLIVGVNALVYRYYPGTRVMRYVAATSLMLFSLIYIQQYFGRIEMHFHVFIAIAFLTLYKDIYPIMVAAAVTTAHHLVFNYLQLYDVHLFGTPVIVFNYGCGLDIVFLHAVFVVFEALIIGYIVKVQIDQSVAILLSKAEINKLNGDLELENLRNRKLAKEFEQFAYALDESAIVSKTDDKGIITYVNNKFCQVSGYSRSELIGISHNVIRHPDMPSEVFRELWATVSAKKIFKGIMKNRKKDGGAFYAESIIIPLLDLEGNIVEHLCVRYDVTELIHSRDRALAAEKAKDRFLSNMSHELRTPLNAIMGFIQIVRMKTADDETRRYLDITFESSKTLLKLINDILDLSKIQSGKFSLQPLPFKPKPQLEKLILSFEGMAGEKDIRIAEKLDTSLEQELVGDWGRISQVITNLIANAIKFTPKNGTVTITASYSRDRLVCCVSDTGIGMNDQAKRRIFDPFEQADVSTTRKYGGTGLGLSISSELVQRMHGRIEVHSEERKGSSFTIHIPLRAFGQETREMEAPDENKEKRKLCGHILVAEDDRTNQEFFRISLNEMGLTCDMASDGEEALEMFGRSRYDLLLLDENMPFLSGSDVMREIRRTHAQSIPIIAVTANVMSGDRERFLAEGMDAFIGKPVELKELYGVLGRYLKPCPDEKADEGSA